MCIHGGIDFKCIYKKVLIVTLLLNYVQLYMFIEMHFLYIHTCNNKQPIILKRVSINTRMLYAFIFAHC